MSSASASSSSGAWIDDHRRLKPQQLETLRNNLRELMIADLVEAEAPFDTLVPRARRCDKINANVARIRANALTLEQPEREAILYLLDRIDSIDDDRYSRKILLVPYALPRKLRASLYYSKHQWGIFAMRLPCRGLRCTVQLSIKRGVPTDCGPCEIRMMRRPYLDVVMPLASLELPSYVLMWLIRRLDWRWPDGRLRELELLRLIDAVGAAWRSRAAGRPTSLANQ
jgi:hypothetical protein